MKKKVKKKKLTPENVWVISIKFLKDISTPKSSKSVIRKYKETIDILSRKLSRALETEKEVIEYLNYILGEIDNLNKYFKRVKKGSIPFSMIFAFANKNERLSAFLMEKNFSKRKKGEVYEGMAGFEGPDDSEKSLEPDSFSVFF